MLRTASTFGSDNMVLLSNKLKNYDPYWGDFLLDFGQIPPQAKRTINLTIHLKLCLSLLVLRPVFEKAIPESEFSSKSTYL